MLCTHPVSSDSESGRAARYGNSISRHDRDKLKMELERGNGVAVWRQIETTLTEEIGAQHFAPGEQLPNELLLATRFGVNRHTVRRALSELAEAGLVRIEQGRGTFVQESAIDYTIARRTRFSHNIRSLGLTPSMELLREAELPAPADIADVLCLRKGTKLLRLTTLGRADGRPVDLADNYFAAKRFAAMPEAVRRTGSISTALIECGVADYTRSRTRVSARMPDGDIARWLDQPRSRPVLRVESINVDEAGNAFQFSIAHFGGDSVQLQFDPDAGTLVDSIR